MRIYRLEEARNKERFFKNHSKLTPKQKEELIKLYSEQYIPDDIIDWNKIESYSFEDLKAIAEDYLKEREEKRNKKNLSKAIEGRDYIKVFENTNEKGTEYLYLPLTWIGSKYLASDHFLPKIKVPSEQMNASDFSDTTAKNTDLSPGVKWCISLWTFPDLIINDKPFKTLEGKELRHEGKIYWLSYTSEGHYFLFYFRDYDKLEDINKKIAFTLRQGSSRIENITLADDTVGGTISVIKRVQDYWNQHYKEYDSQIKHIQEMSKEEYPKFSEYEEQKEQEAIVYRNSHRKEYTLIEEFIYNEETGRYDSEGDIYSGHLDWLIEHGEFTVPLGVINGDFNCGNSGLKSLKNGPTIIYGDFSCHENSLTSLEYAPREVHGSFFCSGNKLTSLEYSPKYIGWLFNCSDNQLKTLKGAPKRIEGEFICSYNQLTSLEGAPEHVGGDFECSFNNLTTLEYAPHYVGGYFDCKNNPLQSKELSTEVRGSVYY